MPTSRASASARRVVVAGQQHNTAHALTPEQLDRVARRLARAIGERDDAERATVARDEHRRAARCRQRVQPRVNRGVAQPPLFDEPVIPDQRRVAADDRFGAASWYRLELSRRGQRDAGLDSPRQNGAADRMLRSRLEPCGDLQDLARSAVSFSGMTSTTCGTPLVSVPVLSNATQRPSRCARDARRL